MLKVNNHKKKYLEHLFNIGSFKSSFPIWKKDIKTSFGSPFNGNSLFELGNNLSNIFKKTSDDTQSQSQKTAGGAAWECLITWYLNLIFWNTPVIAVRSKKDFVPSCIMDSLTVTISANSTNSESDIVIFDVPEHYIFDKNNLKIHEHYENNIEKSTLINLQCKTNWNDSAQIPMLWDMVYNSTSKLPHVSVGRNGFNPQSYLNFKYAFVTVPTQKRPIKSDSVAVARVKNITGGNYWGKETKKDVALCINELPGRFYSKYFSGGVKNHLDKLCLDPNYLKIFFK